MNDFVPQWVVERLGKRVVLTSPVGGHPVGTVGVVISIQSGFECLIRRPYATVALDIRDTSDEENVRFDQMAPYMVGEGDESQNEILVSTSKSGGVWAARPM